MEQNVEQICPICNKVTTQLSYSIGSNNFGDYICATNIDSHVYRCQTVEDDITKMTVRIIDNGEPLFFQISYDKNITEIWTKPNNIVKKVDIKTVFHPNFSELDNLINKLKLYLLVS